MQFFVTFTFLFTGVYTLLEFMTPWTARHCQSPSSSSSHTKLSHSQARSARFPLTCQTTWSAKRRSRRRRKRLKTKPKPTGGSRGTWQRMKRSSTFRRTRTSRVVFGGRNQKQWSSWVTRLWIALIRTFLDGKLIIRTPRR